MPAHGGHIVNMMEEGKSLNLIMDINLLPTPLPCVKSYVIQNGVFPGCSPDCCECQNQPEGCVSLKIGIQSLINEGILKIGRESCRERGGSNFHSIYSYKYSGTS